VKTPLLTFISLLLAGTGLWAQPAPGLPAPRPQIPGAPAPAAPASPAAPAQPVPGPISRFPRQLPTLRSNSVVVPSNAGASNAPARGATASPTEKMIEVKPSPQATTGAPEDLIPAGTIDWRGVDLAQAFTIYAELKNRTILRPAQLAAQQIYLTTKTALTRKEAIQALDTVLGMNGITMIDFGDKFVKASLSPTAFQEGAPFSKLDDKQLPEMGSYVTHVVQLQYAKPSELLQVLQPFSKIPNAILPIDSSQILVLRDFTENVKRMLEMIKEIDVAVPSEYDQEVIPIKYALATEIANALNSLSTGGASTSVGKSSSSGFRSSGSGTTRPGMGSGYPGTTTPYGTQPGVTGTTPGTSGSSFQDRLQGIIRKVSASGEVQILGMTKIIADERTNSLLVFASREDMKMIKKIVGQLDIVLAQVLIEAVILEVQLTDSHDLGVSYIQYPQSVGNVTGVGAGGAGSKFFNAVDFQRTASGLTNAGAGLAAGFNYLLRINQDLDVTITAIQANSRAKVLQRPRIQTSHAEQATLFVGESRPYPQGSYYGGGAYGGYSTIQQLQIGVTLEVKPLINTDGLVVMDIHQKIESANGFVDLPNVGQVPITSQKDATAKVAVRDRETIIMGGLIETDKSNTKSGIPILMDIPLLGYLFRGTSVSEIRKEFIVLIRPTVLPTPEAAALTAKVEKDNMPGIRTAEAEFKAEHDQRLKEADREVEALKRKEAESAKPKSAPTPEM
jgi:general secretion pathway protein D